MITKEIPREEWVDFLNSFSLQHERWLVTIELLGPDIGAQVQAEDLPLQGISADLKGIGMDTISILVGTTSGGHLSHTVASPTCVRLEQREDGADVALQIETDAGSSTLVRLRSIMAPERFDGVLP